MKSAYLQRRLSSQQHLNFLYDNGKQNTQQQANIGRISIYPTIQIEDVFQQRTEFLRLYKEYILHKENIIQCKSQQDLIPQNDLIKPQKSISVITPTLEVRRPFNKKLLLRSQILRYRNLALYDKIKLNNLSIEAYNKSVDTIDFKESLKITKQPVNMHMYALSRQAPQKRQKEQPQQQQNTVNYYSRQLVLLAKHKSLEKKQCKIVKLSFPSCQNSPQKQEQDISKQEIVNKKTQQQMPFINLKQKQRSQQISPVSKVKRNDNEAQDNITDKKIKKNQILKKLITGQAQYISQKDPSKPTFRGWDTNPNSNRSFSQ